MPSLAPDPDLHRGGREMTRPATPTLLTTSSTLGVADPRRAEFEQSWRMLSTAELHALLEWQPRSPALRAAALDDVACRPTTARPVELFTVERRMHLLAVPDGNVPPRFLQAVARRVADGFRQGQRLRAGAPSRRRARSRRGPTQQSPPRIQSRSQCSSRRSPRSRRAGHERAHAGDVASGFAIEGPDRETRSAIEALMAPADTPFAEA